MVLTSTYGIDRPRRDGNVDRSLRLRYPVPIRRTPINRIRTVHRNAVNRRLVGEVCGIHRPDVVYVWSLSFLEPTLPEAARDTGVPVCYFVSDYWLASSGQRLGLRHVQFASEHVKRVT